MIHRDVKPSNLVVNAKMSNAKLIDFGIARADEGYYTKTGQILGTPGYRAPEQLGRKEAAAVPRSDQWALAAILYRQITGRA